MDDTVKFAICKGGPYDGTIHPIGENIPDKLGFIFNMSGKQGTPRAVYLFTDEIVDIPGGTAQVAQYKEPENAYTSDLTAVGEDSYADTWNALPRDLQDRFGADEPFTTSEWNRLLRAGVPSSPRGGSWVLEDAFRMWVAQHLDEEADGVDHLPERVAVGKIPLDKPRDDLPTLDDETVHKADSLRERAPRLRDG